MRWTMLFADLEAQLDATERGELGALVAELTRAERAAITVADRLRSALGTRVRAILVTGRDVEGVLREVHPEWALVEVDGRDCILPGPAVAVWSGLGDHAVPDARDTRPGARLFGLGHALRVVARDRRRVLVSTSGGDRVGVILRVGRDHLDLLADPTGGALHGRRDVGVWTIPFGAVLQVSAVDPM